MSFLRSIGGTRVVLKIKSSKRRMIGSRADDGVAVNSMFARLGTDYERRNQWFFAILEAMTTD